MDILHYDECIIDAMRATGKEIHQSRDFWARSIGV